jgi:hypothetical protein
MELWMAGEERTNRRKERTAGKNEQRSFFEWRWSIHEFDKLKV